MIGESECCSMTNNNIDPATSNKVSLVHTCSRAFLSAVPLMLPCEGDGEGGKECWGGYLFFRWSMKVSRLRSMSACAGWWGLPGSGRRWPCAGAQRCGPAPHWRSAARCFPACDIHAGTPGHRWRSCDLRHAPGLVWERDEKGRGGVEEREECGTSIHSVMHDHTHTCNSTNTFTDRRWRRMEWRGGREKNGMRC